jgi:hypothetical protein
MKSASLKLSSKQKAAINLLSNPVNDHIREVLYGGAKGGGKSFLGAAWLTDAALRFAGTSYFVARKNLNDLRLYTYPVFQEVFKCIGLTAYKYNGQDNVINFANGSRIIFLSANYLPSDPLFERFGSLQHTWGWIEEGGEIADEAAQNLKLSIGRWLNKEYGLPYKLLVTANPKKNWMLVDFINSPPECNRFVQAFAQDNPFLPEDYKTTLLAIKDKVTRQRLLLGMWDYEDDESNLIPYNKIIDCFTNDFVPEGNRYISSDVAITNDMFVLVVWSGFRIIDISAIQNISRTVTTRVDGETVSRVDFTPLLDEYHRLTTAYQIPRSNIVYDADGIGHNMRTYLAGAIGINNGSPSISPEYQNLKTQLYYLFAEMVNSDKIYIQASMSGTLKERLISEMQAIRRSSDVGEKLKIMPKAEVKQILGHSPDLTDAIVYRLLFYLTRHT